MGTEADARRAAELHVSEISEGFLSTLGPAFLERLYRRIVRTPRSFLAVAEAGGQVLGFAAATESTRDLYRQFLVRDGVVSAVTAAPRLARALPRVLETLRYPTHPQELPGAELLSLAVSPEARGRGIGRSLMEMVTEELRRRGVTAGRAVVGASNHTALEFYRACGLRTATRIELHGSASSEVLTWP